MSKKIDEARKNLAKALKSHAEAVGGAHVTLKHAERATAKLQKAAEKYTEAVRAKTGIETSFTSAASAGLDAATIHSLAAEREKIQKQITGPIPLVAK